MIKLKLIWAGHVACMTEKISGFCWETRRKEITWKAVGVDRRRILKRTLIKV